ncbi:reverse transcriptase domain-containing protein [Tanacetum coccineum]
MPEKSTPTWTLFTDGASSIEGSGAGLILTDPNGKEITYALRFDFRASNNEAEYEALVAGLELAIQMEAYITQIPRSKNKRADALRKLASSSFAHLTKSVLVEVVPCRSIEVRAINTIEEVGPVQADYVLREAHLGSCGAHTGPRSIAQKAARLGYYWPTMYRDATRVWGIDIVGPFPEAPGRVKFLIVAIDYFTKWAEAEPIATITGHKWVEELLNVLWAYRTTARAGNGCTPFSLVYGSEVVLPPEIGLPTYQVSTFQPATNDTELRLNLDFLEERREMASLRNARYKRQIESYYNKKVRHNQLRIGDFVLRKNEASRQEGQMKLDPNWEGPTK